LEKNFDWSRVIIPDPFKEVKSFGGAAARCTSSAPEKIRRLDMDALAVGSRPVAGVLQSGVVE
jgi:hypothetical protein